MNEYKFDNFNIGIEHSFKVIIQDEDLEKFKEISGDYNPMHIDSEYAQEHGFNSKIVYGMLTASMYSRLVGMYLPGKYCILKAIETSFDRPVYVYDEINVEGRVVEKDERFGNAKIKAKIKNQEGKIVSRATILVGFYE